MKTAAKQALVSWAVGLALVIVALFAVLGAPGSSEGAGEAIGRAFAHTGLAALATWMLARGKEPPWSWARFGATYLAAIVVVAIVVGAGRTARADHHRPAVAAPVAAEIH